MCWHPTKDIIATTVDSKIAGIIDSTGKKLMNFQHGDDVNEINWHPTQDIIATASDDKTARIIDIAGNELMCFKHDSSVNSVRWHHAGDIIITRSYDETVGVFKHYTDYTLEQVQLKCALTTWLLLEKPSKEVLKLEKKDEQINILLADVAKKCGLDYDKECVNVWSTFPINMQRAIRRTMMYRIKTHGKNITDNTKKRGNK